MKTISQIKTDLIKVFGEENEDIVRGCVNASVEFAQRWIDVEEELPEARDHSVDIEMRLDNMVVVSGYLFCDGDWMKYDEDGRGSVIKRKVTHWRHIELK